MDLFLKKEEFLKAKKSDRIAAEGLASCNLKIKIGSCRSYPETDFVGKNQEFKDFAAAVVNK